MPESSPRDPDVARDLQNILVGVSGVDEFLVEVARLAGRILGGAVACGVTLRATQHSRPIGATSDEFARRMDEIQHDVGDGPCMTALRQGVTVVIADLAGDDRWPEFSRRGSAEGASCVMSVPLRPQGPTIGVLTLYGRAPYLLSEQDHIHAIRFVEQSAAAVALAVRISDHEDRSRHLETALTSRTTIDQALGILMGQRHIPADEAFTVLRQLSQRANVKLRDVAAALISETVPERARREQEPPSE